MTQTENLKLNTWSADDPVNVAQINQNFQKIDTASKYVKLMEISDTSGGANQININLAGINLRDYAYLELTGNLSGYVYGSTQMLFVGVRLNGISGNYYYRTRPDANSVARSESMLVSVCSDTGHSNQSSSFFRIRLFPCRNLVLAETTSGGYRGSFNASTDNFYFSYYGGVANSDLVTPDTLTQVNFYLMDSVNKFVSGSKILVYGVRR